MINLASVTAKIVNNEIFIDTRDIAHNSDEREKLDPPWRARAQRNEEI